MTHIDYWPDPKDERNIIVDFSTKVHSSELMAKESQAPDLTIDTATGFPIEQIWVTEDGRRIPIAHLGSDHIVNIILHLRVRMDKKWRSKICNKIAKSILNIKLQEPKTSVTHLLDEAHSAVELNAHELLNRYHKQYPLLIAEAYKRELVLTPCPPSPYNGSMTDFDPLDRPQVKLNVRFDKTLVEPAPEPKYNPFPKRKPKDT